MNFQAGLASEGFKAYWGDSFAVDRDMESVCKTESYRMTCARRDFAAMQICIFPHEGGTLTVGGAAAFSPYGARSGLRVAVQMEEFSPKLQHIGYATVDDGTQRTDILLNDETVEMESGRVHPIWVEFAVPEDAKAGEYHGTVRIYEHFMFGAETLVKEFPITLCVKDVVMPAKPTFYLDLWQCCSNIARKHEVALWSDAHFDILERYVASMGELGQRAVSIIVSEIPWTGHRAYTITDYISDMYEYSMIRVTRRTDGTYVYDYTPMQRYIDLCAKYGIEDEIETFGLCNIWTEPSPGFEPCSDYPDEIRVRYLDEADGCYKFMDNKEDISHYIRALHDYFIETNQIDRVRVAADEPADIGIYRERISLLKQLAPRFQYKAAIDHIEFIEEFKEDIFDLAPTLPFAARELKTMHETRKRENGRVTFYLACRPQYPNMFIVSPLSESRLTGLLAWYLDLDGFLRWNYTAWPENPRERISYRACRWKAGDTNYVYPSRGGDVLLTLRYKALKRGIGDYELARMANLSNDDALWDKVLKEKDIAKFHKPDFSCNPDECYEQDYAAYDAFKEELLSRLETK